MKKHNNYILILIALVTFLLAITLSIVTALLIAPNSKSRLSGEGKDIVIRAIDTLGVDVDENKIFNRISSGSISVGDYVATTLVSSEYLLQGKDDYDFARDLAYILYGDESTDKDVNSIYDSLDSTSRIYVVNEYASDVDVHFALTSNSIDEKGTQVESCEITKPLSGESEYTIGIRQVEGSFDITGDEVRTDFYVDGIVYQATIKYDDSKEDFTVSWDTSGVSEGYHEVKILLRSSDGRGYVVDGGDVLIPHCLEIVNGGVSNGSILASNEDAWYALFVDSGDAYVNFVDLSGDIGVELYDIYGELIGGNDLENSTYEVLRGREQNIPEIEMDTGIIGLRSTYYVHVYRSEGDAELSSEETDAIEYQEITYKMVQTPNVARYDGNYYAVKDCNLALPTPLPVKNNTNDLKDTVVTLVDLSGNEMDMTIDSVTFLPLNGFLNDMKITNVATGNELLVTPVFNTKDLFYGYYITSGIDTIQIEANSIEGYASNIVISDGKNTYFPGDQINLVSGENEITVSINSFADITKEYKIFILYGNDNGDFYEKTLTNFPVSYYDGLWLLHSLHPNYVFEAYNTNLDYYTVLDNEDNADRNLASCYSHPGWTVESSPVYDGGGWKQAKYDVVNYFLDPRNFLNQRNIFTFEKLSFDANAQTVEGVRSMLKGSFMDTDELDYAQIIYDAGKTANVSPYFLASRILQEMGYNGESLLCQGKLPGYEGYYNFYNIGSTPDPSIENGALINGAKYAMWGRDPEGQTITEEEASLMLPWNSVDRAITGGALWIASRYTSAGQDTLYFQKFDVIDNEDGLYIHQYAQNISMANTEGARYFDSYASIGMIDQNFVFIIPVYENMPYTYGYLPEPY